MLLIILSFFLATLHNPYLAHPCEVEGKVAKIDSESLTINLDKPVSPGTILKTLSSSSEKKYKVKKRLTEYSVVATPLDEGGNGTISELDELCTNSPLHSYVPITLKYTEGFNPPDWLKTIIKNQNIITVNSGHSDIEIKGKNSSIRILFGDKDKIIQIANVEDPRKEITLTLKKIAGSKFFSTLDNFYLKGPRSLLNVYYDGNNVNQITLGSEVFIHFAIAFDGYVTILAPQLDGDIFVLYPNKESQNPIKKFEAFKTYDLSDYANRSFFASSKGNTEIVMLVSKTKRSLNEFIPEKVIANFKDGSDQLLISADKIGPGVIDSSLMNQKNTSGIDFLDATTWDLARASFMVVDK